MSNDLVWVFNVEGQTLASAVFSTYELAQVWIEKYDLTGSLTPYPIDIIWSENLIETYQRQYARYKCCTTS